ncbi:MAG: hypothetical protein L6Q37_08320 [Bdellovibrionaceae bacterium]|nr:hypothetical protein [Pseudobdellovibrionaceae bacterium]
MNYTKKKSRKSIRTIIISWFLLLSILPLLFVAYYSTVKYEQAIDKELSQRLSVNAREVEVIIADFKSGLQLKREKYLRDLNLIYSLSVSDFETLRSLSEQILSQDSTSEINFYNREGRLVSRVYKNEKRSVIKDFPKDEAVFLSEKFLSYLKTNKEIGSLDYFDNKIGLGLISRIQNQNQVNLGYIQQIVYFDRSFLQMLKTKLKLEFFLAKEDTRVITTSFADKNFQFSEVIRSSILESKEQIFEIEIKKWVLCEPGGVGKWSVSFGPWSFKVRCK